MKQTIDRRRFLKVSGQMGIALSAAGAIGLNGNPVWGRTNNAISFVPDGMLEPFTTLPVNETWVTQSTELAPQRTLSEDCTMKVYPQSSRSTTAYSAVMFSEDLNATPNQFLVQKLTYETPHVATVDFHRITQDAVDILAGELIVQPNVAESDTPDGDGRRFEFVGSNSYAYALQIERREDTITILRVGSFDSDQWAFLENVEGWAFGLDFQTEVIEPHETGWHVGYGPFDFHPSVYEPVDCFGP